MSKKKMIERNTLKFVDKDFFHKRGGGEINILLEENLVISSWNEILLKRKDPNKPEKCNWTLKRRKEANFILIDEQIR